MDDLTRIRLLEEENQVLRDRIEWLERELLGRTDHVPLEWGLTGMQARFILALARRAEMTKEQLLVALYSDRNEEPGPKIVDVFVHHLRRKLKRHGVEITTLWGRGYALDAATRRKLAPKETPS